MKIPIHKFRLKKNENSRKTFVNLARCQSQPFLSFACAFCLYVSL